MECIGGGRKTFIYSLQQNTLNGVQVKTPEPHKKMR